LDDTGLEAELDDTGLGAGEDSALGVADEGSSRDAARDATGDAAEDSPESTGVEEESLVRTRVANSCIITVPIVESLTLAEAKDCSSAAIHSSSTSSSSAQRRPPMVLAAADSPASTK